jgi:hypothetical protein
MACVAGVPGLQATRPNAVANVKTKAEGASRIRLAGMEDLLMGAPAARTGLAQGKRSDVICSGVV